MLAEQASELPGGLAKRWLALLGADMLEQQPFGAQFLGCVDLSPVEQVEGDAKNAGIAQRPADAPRDLS